MLTATEDTTCWLCVIFPPVEGESEAEAAYEEAMNDIFNLQLECHRHQQPHTNHKGLLRWEMIEMWPMPVSRCVTSTMDLDSSRMCTIVC